MKEEIQQQFKTSLNDWADIMLDLQVKGLNSQFRYNYEDVMNMLIIFQEVTHNVAFYKNGNNVDELARAEQFGKDIRKLITNFCGFDPAEYYNKNKPVLNR